jgi:hypothetical protein
VCARIGGTGNKKPTRVRVVAVAAEGEQKKKDTRGGGALLLGWCCRFSWSATAQRPQQKEQRGLVPLLKKKKSKIGSSQEKQEAGQKEFAAGIKFKNLDEDSQYLMYVSFT